MFNESALDVLKLVGTFLSEKDLIHSNLSCKLWYQSTHYNLTRRIKILESMNDQFIFDYAKKSEFNSLLILANLSLLAKLGCFDNEKKFSLAEKSPYFFSNSAFMYLYSGERLCEIGMTYCNAAKLLLNSNLKDKISSEQYNKLNKKWFSSQSVNQISFAESKLSLNVNFG